MTNSVSKLRESLEGMPTFQGIKPQGAYQPGQSAYKGRSISGSLPEYDAIRARLNSNYSQIHGQAQDALDRQFAAMGGGPGNGAQAKQTENLAGTIARQKSQDLEGLNFQEAAERRMLQKEEDQRAFQSGEALAQRNFAGEEAHKGRESENEKFNKQAEMQHHQFKFEAGTKLEALNLQSKEFHQQEQQMKMDQWNHAFNAAMKRIEEGERSANFDYLMNNYLQNGKEKGFLK